MKRTAWGSVLVLVAWLPAWPAMAEEAAQLEPVTVTAERLARPVLESPLSVGLVDEEAIGRATQNIALDESLARIPGVFAQNRYNFSQDVRVSIRGFGARSPFGIRGIKVLLDDIPETLVDGQSQVDMIDPFMVERMEVLRGPAGALYGNASGGVLSVYTHEGVPGGEVNIEQKHGEHGLRRTAVRAGEASGRWNWSAGASEFSYDGYREHSRARRYNFNARVGYEIDERSSLTALVGYVDAPDTQDPGSLTAAEVAEDRRQARPQSLTFDGGQSAEQARLGLVYRSQLSANEELVARGFYLHRDFDNRLPFQNGGIVAFERDFAGGSLQYIRSDTIGGRDNQLSAGADLAHQHDDRQRYDNLQGERGDLALDQREIAQTTAVFVRNNLSLSPLWDLSVGARVDEIRFRIEDRFLTDGDDSGRRRFRETSWFAGTSYALAPTHRVFINAGSSFETPTFTEFANPDGGGFNPDIEPEQAQSLEFGLRGSDGRDVRYELVAFMARVEDELIPFQTEPGGRDFFRNAGRTARDGLEFSIDWRLPGGAYVVGAGTWGRYVFRDFSDDDGNVFDGNNIPGLPREQVFLEFGLGRGQPFFAALNMESRSRLFADDANQVEVPRYTVWNARVGREWQLGQWRLEPYAGVNNLLNEEYNSNIRINTTRFNPAGPNPPAPFEPAPERNWHAGVNLSLRGL